MAITDPLVALLIDELLTAQKRLTARVEELENDLNTVWPARSYDSRHECAACVHRCEDY